MKIYFKSLFKMLWQQKTRVIILMLLFMISIGISSGLGSVGPLLDDSFTQKLDELKYADLMSFSTDQLGFSKTDIDRVKSHESIDGIVEAMLIPDFKDEGIRSYIYPLNDQNSKSINQLRLIGDEGRWPSSNQEVVVERGTSSLKSYEIGEFITFNVSEDYQLTLKIVGIVENPQYLYKQDIPSSEQEGAKSLHTIIYSDKEHSIIPIVTTNLLYMRISGDERKPYFTNSYKHSIDDLLNTLVMENAVTYGYNESITYRAIDENIHKINVISYLFPTFFIVVITIVIITSMTRLIENDRVIAGTLLSLGYTKIHVSIRYFFISIFAAIIGGLLGIYFGYYVLAKLIFDAYRELLSISTIASISNWNFGYMIFSFMTFIVILAMIYISVKMLREKPAQLFRHKAPKIGNKIFLERIPFIWNRFKFKYKSTLRNIFRYPMHFFLTVFTVSGSTALVFAGLSLYDNTQALNNDQSTTITLIAVIIILAAAALSILVTYNLTNMNIEERQREIATLKVLGYKHNEVSGYIFREMFIISTIGIVLGYPLGIGFTKVVFDYIDYGTLENVTLLTWIFTILTSFCFIIITDMLLYRKIINLDMNESLKTID